MVTGRPTIVVLARHADDRPPHLEQLQDRADVVVTDAAGLADAVTDADALFLWDFFSSALREVWPHCSRLRWVHVAAAGVDSLVFPELADSEVVVTNARGTFDRPIAEYVLGVVLAHAKQTHVGADLQRQHVWRHRETRSVQGATAAVVGTGAIGRECARLLSAVGMRVRGFGRTPRQSDPDFGSVTPSSELVHHVADVDYLVMVAPLTPATRGLVDATVLDALPATAHLVNVGRGECVVTADLVEALRAGSIDGASLDVVDPEPLPADSPLWDLPGVHLTAHMSGDVSGWLDTLAWQFVDNAERWLAGDEPANVVDTRLGFVPSGTT